MSANRWRPDARRATGGDRAAEIGEDGFAEGRLMPLVVGSGNHQSRDAAVSRRDHGARLERATLGEGLTRAEPLGRSRHLHQAGMAAFADQILQAARGRR